MPVASAEIVRKVDEAMLWMVGISLVLFVGIVLAMLVFVVRYRRARHPKAEQIAGNMKLEITWIVVPTIIVLFMFYKGYEGFLTMRSPPAGSMVVEVEARSWAWTFTYPEDKVSSPELYVPVDQPVRLDLTAAPRDVIHSFYLPAFRVKEDCVPGRVSTLWFEADSVGVYPIFCAEYCGAGHSRMGTKLRVLPREDYERWLDEKVAHRYRPVEIEAAMDPRSPEIRECGAPALYATYCVSCHGEDGGGGFAAEGARDFRSLEGWKRGSRIVDIFRTLTLGLEGTRMAAFPNLSAWDRFALAHHVAAFYEGDDRPVSTPEEQALLVDEFDLDVQQEYRRRFPIDEAMRDLVDEAEDDEGDDGR